MKKEQLLGMPEAYMWSLNVWHVQVNANQNMIEVHLGHLLSAGWNYKLLFSLEQTAQTTHGNCTKLL